MNIPVYLAIVLLLLTVFLLVGCSLNGRPMRFAPGTSGSPRPKSECWHIAGQSEKAPNISCSFIEFDERGDFLDFEQHIDCQGRIRALAGSNRLVVVMYCHGWKNNSQSGDVTEFVSFLTKLAASEQARRTGAKVHGVYLGWRGNAFRPFVDKSNRNDSYHETLEAFGEPIVDARYHRRFSWTYVIPETLSYWARKGAAEHKVSGLPMARALFTYASAAKDYGNKLENRVFVIGHSFGALMLEKSLGQAMVGEITMEWWDREKKAPTVKTPQERRTEQMELEKPGLPFDLVLFLNSAAPSIYAKEMRDFLKAHRSALGRAQSAEQDVPVIVSLTSTADWATGVVHPLGNMCARFAPSLRRRYTTGIFGDPPRRGAPYPTHKGIRQSDFYIRTPGHQPYLVNHWITKEPAKEFPQDPRAVFEANLSRNAADPDVFFTSTATYPAAAWRISKVPPAGQPKLDGMAPSMADSDYWIVSCGKELIGGHNDVWSTTTMEVYAGIFRAVESRRGPADSDATNPGRTGQPQAEASGPTASF
jgi:hypothetical protein